MCRTESYKMTVNRRESILTSEYWPPVINLDLVEHYAFYSDTRGRKGALPRMA